MGQEGSRFRYQATSPTATTTTHTVTTATKDDGDTNHAIDYQGSNNIVDVLCLPYTQYGFIGVGTVHHVAWRTPTDEQQELLRNKIINAGLNATPVIDRIYFHSVYFREPGGILFEIATNPPGFTIDEKAQELGTHLMLPKWLEPVRTDLEKVLPRVNLTEKKEQQQEVIR